MDFISIWVILKLIKIGPKSPNSEGSGSDQNPDRKAREPSPDRANNKLGTKFYLGEISSFRDLSNGLVTHYGDAENICSPKAEIAP